jgi:hypothetical protein
MKKIIMSVVASIVLVGCSSGIKMVANTQVSSFSEPELNQVTEATIGDYMVNQGVSVTNDYLKVKQGIDGAYYNIGAGSYKEFGVDSSGKKYFSITSNDGGFVTPGILVDPPYALHPDAKKGLCVSSVIVRNATCYDEAQTEIVRKSVESNNSFQQTLIYNGSVGQKINISYREFKNDMARGAFTNDVEYDMSKSDVIKYRGATIEVLSYDNSSIKYKVLTNFR